MTAIPVAKETPDGKYFHIMLNMADDDLDVYEYRLLGHYVRVCNVNGTGQCWESTRTTADKCKMSVGKVSSTRKSLEAKGYLKLLQPDQHSKGDTLMVLVVDRWAENINRYSSQAEQTELKVIECSPHEQTRSPDEQERSPHETKNNNIRKTNEQDSTPAPQAESVEDTKSDKSDLSKHIALLESITVMTPYYLTLLKEDAKLYTLEEWTAAVGIVKERMRETTIKTPYKYLLGVLKSRAVEAKNAPPPVVIPYHQPAPPPEPELSDEERAKALEAFRASKPDLSKKHIPMVGDDNEQEIA